MMKMICWIFELGADELEEEEDDQIKPADKNSIIITSKARKGLLNNSFPFGFYLPELLANK
jgi:hypothetical protein